MSERIFLVDDEQHIIDLVRLYLQQEGFRVESAGEGQEALDRILAQPPDLVVLDLMLPGLDGREICRRVRARSDLPIIMLTARDDDVDKIVGLELGADDYLTKPFNPRELLARIRAILRRSVQRGDAQGDERPLVIGNLRILPTQYRVQLDGVEVRLRRLEFDLLHTLARRPGMVFSRDQLLSLVWDYEVPGQTRTVDVHIAHLRHKLAGMQAGIETVWGVGYRLETLRP
ncbi:MAG: response regulator transcription factor [Anaerolineaceae bacterium]|nr:response regulator transcription factor [Anaerolineaceae bacterium]MDE0329007.1 response regulator transcription factor [Anaerolineaceae bacterium]